MVWKCVQRFQMKCKHTNPKDPLSFKAVTFDKPPRSTHPSLLSCLRIFSSQAKHSPHFLPQEPAEQLLPRSSEQPNQTDASCNSGILSSTGFIPSQPCISREIRLGAQICARSISNQAMVPKVHFTKLKRFADGDLISKTSK